MFCGWERGGGALIRRGALIREGRLVQNGSKGGRLIEGRRLFDKTTSYDSLLSKVRLKSIEHHRYVQSLLLLHKCVYNFTPNYIKVLAPAKFECLRNIPCFAQ